MRNRKAPLFRPAFAPTPEQQEEQRRARDRQRPTSTARGYDADWRALRADVLEAEPWCRRCRGLGVMTRATDVDHVQPVAARPDLRLVRSNLMPLCHPHHSERTARFDGGFGNARKAKPE
jgi:5-methylcytosine-specific restriction protein A